MEIVPKEKPHYGEWIVQEVSVRSSTEVVVSEIYGNLGNKGDACVVDIYFL